jgi:arginase family enzyme
MLNNTIRILNFDNSILRQEELLSQYNAEIIDFKDIGPQARLWLDKKTRQLIGERIRHSAEDSVTFLGSGDFHHISSLLINQFQEPLSVIVFDHHPDWDILPPKFGCGSWVNRALEKNNVFKVILLGVSSNDISSFWIQTGNLRSLKKNRLQIFPYAHQPTRVVLKNIPQNHSVALEKKIFSTIIHWQELRNKDLEEFFLQIINRLPTKQLYLSIDKDCLKSDYALTNWEEGYFRLEEMLMLLRLAKERLDIVGLDITGDYSQPLVAGRIKAFFSRRDHPRDYTAKDKSEDLINSINEETNIRILEALKG